MNKIAQQNKAMLRNPLRLWKNLRYRIPRAASDRAHIFILGAPRSGTNLLKVLLVAHPRIGGCDYESTGLFDFRDIFQYRIGHLKPDRVEALRQQAPDLVAFYDRITEAILEKKGKDIFVDKMKHSAWRLRYVNRYFPNARFVHVVRDGRDSFCSALKHPNVNQSEDIETYARYWMKHVTGVDGHVDPDRLFEVKYEDLTSSPEEHLPRLMEFLGISFAPRQLEHTRYGKTTTLTNREVHQGLGQPINVASQYRWKEELTPEQNKAFCRIAGKELEKHGYDQFA